MAGLKNEVWAPAHAARPHPLSGHWADFSLPHWQHGFVMYYVDCQ